jgi:hypothetical protein
LVVASATVKRSILALVVIGSALLGAVAMIFAMVGYAFVQSQDSAFAVWIANDGPTPLVVRDCGDRCADSHDEVPLLPGAKVAASAVPNIPNWWRVEDRFGHPLGCLALVFGSTRAGAIVRTSQRQDCPP